MTRVSLGVQPAEPESQRGDQDACFRGDRQRGGWGVRLRQAQGSRHICLEDVGVELAFRRAGLEGQREGGGGRLLSPQEPSSLPSLAAPPTSHAQAGTRPPEPKRSQAGIPQKLV